MAWQAYLASKLTPANAGGCSVSVFYYDDADPANAGVGLAGPGQGTAAASTDLIAITAHGLLAGDQVIFTALTGGVGLQLDTPYYVIATGLTANAFSVSTRPGGTAVDIKTNATTVTAYKLIPPTNVLYAQTFPLAVGKDINALLPDIDRAGQQMRIVQQQADSINAQIPIGTIRPVP
jgi:hypothetical protein